MCDTAEAYVHADVTQEQADIQGALAEVNSGSATSSNWQQYIQVGRQKFIYMQASSLQVAQLLFLHARSSSKNAALVCHSAIMLTLVRRHLNVRAMLVCLWHRLWQPCSAQVYMHCRRRTSCLMLSWQTVYSSCQSSWPALVILGTHYKCVTEC